MKRKAEWHNAWDSAVEDCWCERGHKQASKSLQGAHSFCQIKKNAKSKKISVLKGLIG